MPVFANKQRLFVSLVSEKSDLNYPWCWYQFTVWLIKITTAAVSIHGLTSDQSCGQNITISECLASAGITPEGVVPYFTHKRFVLHPFTSPPAIPVQVYTFLLQVCLLNSLPPLQWPHNSYFLFGPGPCVVDFGAFEGFWWSHPTPPTTTSQSKTDYTWKEHGSLKSSFKKEWIQNS